MVETENNTNDANALQLLKEMQANFDTLDQCVGPHDFVPENEFSRYRKCTKCGGRMNINEVYWYKQGLLHGKMRRSDGM